MKIGFLFVVLILFLPSCGTIKYLEEDESLVVENQVIIRSEQKIRNKYNLTGELEDIPRLKPNRNFIGIPRQWFYFKTNDPGDSSRFKRFLKRNIAEKPAIYDSSLVEESARIMEKYLYNKGYFDAEVDFETVIRNKRAQVVYTVDPHRRYMVDTLVLISRDSVILDIAESIKDKSVLRKGEPIDNGLFSKEQQRLYDYYQNHGYAGFYPSHVAPLTVDTTEKRNYVTLELLPPSDTLAHTKYFIGDTYVYLEYDPSLGPVYDIEKKYKGITYRTRGEKFRIRPEMIHRRIFFEQNKFYRKRDLEASYDGLRAMNNFKFVSIFPRVDSLRDTILNHNIYLTPSSRFVNDYGIDVNYATIDNQAIQLIGLAVSAKILSRNVFGGGENLDLNLEGGIELNLSNLQDPTSLRFRGQTGLDLQRSVDHLRLFKLLSSVNLFSHYLVSPELYKDFKARADSRVELAYEYNQLIDLYKYNLLQGGLVTNFQKSKQAAYAYSPFGLELYLPTITEAFRQLNEANPNFITEFEENRLLTGFLFRNINYLYKSRVNSRGFNYLFNLNFEQSGLEVFAANSIGNLLANNNNEWMLGDVEFSKYFRFEFDHRQYYSVGANSQFAFRIFAGSAIPYGTSEVVPFIKQFTAGGGLSMRAWRARELGPGGDPFVLDLDRNRNFFQTGDIKLEFNVEYRFPMYWIFNGALFVDAGNVWNLKPNEQSPEGHIDWDFLDEIAIGSGFGVRMDLTLFLLRLDWSYKIRSPFPVPDEGNKKWIFDSLQDLSFRKGTLQFGIDYPF